MGLDKADASLIESQNPDDVIVTEDHPLIAYATYTRKKAIQLIDFLVICSKIGRVDYRVLYRCNQKLRKMRNITKRKYNEVKQMLSSN